MPKSPVNVERAISLLPPTAAPDVELDWCSSHEVLFRDPNPSGDPPFIGLMEIWRPDNGRCPSRRAANMLKHWTRSPKLTAEFHKLLVTQQAKLINTAAPDSNEDVLPPDLADLKQNLIDAAK